MAVGLTSLLPINTTSKEPVREADQSLNLQCPD